MKVRKLHDNFVAEVTGVDFRDAQPTHVKRDLMHLLGEHKILLFRNQHIDTDQLVRFGEIFGRLWGPDDGLENNRASMVDNNEFVYLVSDKGMLGSFQLGWHSDLSWWPCAAQPARILYGVNIDADRIHTPVLFFDLETAYDQASAEDKDLCQQCLALYKILQPRKNDLYVERYGGDGLPAMNRPLVRRHPYTGRLGFNDLGVFLTKSGTVVGENAGRTDQQMKDLLLNLVDRLSPTNVWSHVYRNGDLLIHDNISTMHARPRITGTVEGQASRELKRVTLDIVWNKYVDVGRSADVKAVATA